MENPLKAQISVLKSEVFFPAGDQSDVDKSYYQFFASVKVYVQTFMLVPCAIPKLQIFATPTRTLLNTCLNF